jgi:hypothetical protein
LIADGGSPDTAFKVGEVKVWNDETNLYIEYVVTEPGWCLVQTHLHAATSPGEIPQTKKGNPKVGQFEYSSEYPFEPCEQSPAPYVIPLGDWAAGEKLSIAAHAKVQTIVGWESDLDGFEAALPDQVTMRVVHPGGDSYFNVTITNGGDLNGTYDDWCVDTDHTISPNRNYTADVYSSYETLPDGLVEYPENLDLINWIINQNFVGQPSVCGGNYTYGDVQRAIWELIEDEQSNSGLGSWSQCRVDEIVNAAQLNGGSFEPGCGDVVAVILVPVDGSQLTIAQVTFADVDVPCIPIYRDETAWGGDYFDEPLEFPGDSWAMYFEYIVQ